jgi:hypothetical protein
MPTYGLGMAAVQHSRVSQRDTRARPGSGGECHVEAMLRLQRTIGNRAVSRMVRGPGIIYRKPTAKAPGGIKPAPKAQPAGKPGKLAELVRDPGDAHHAWKGLSKEDRFALLDAMAHRYGRDFADRFHEVAEHGTPDDSLIYWQSGLGPSPRQLTAGGWRRAGIEITGTSSIDVEVWVHPSGRTIRRDVSAGDWTKAVEPPLPPVDPCGEEFAEIKRRLWRAMADLETDVERLEADPQAPDRSSTEARIAAGRTAVRQLTTKLSDLSVQIKSSDPDDPCLDEINQEWIDAMEQLTRIVERFNGIHLGGSGGDRR